MSYASQSGDLGIEVRSLTPDRWFPHCLVGIPHFSHASRKIPKRLICCIRIVGCHTLLLVLELRLPTQLPLPQLQLATAEHQWQVHVEVLQAESRIEKSCEPRFQSKGQRRYESLNRMMRSRARSFFWIFLPRLCLSSKLISCCMAATHPLCWEKGFKVVL